MDCRYIWAGRQRHKRLSLCHDRVVVAAWVKTVDREGDLDVGRSAELSIFGQQPCLNSPFLPSNGWIEVGLCTDR